MRLLLIEDDRKAARLLAKGLQEEGFVVDVAPTGEDGEEKAAVNEYDLIVLDWLLPGKDGLAVCRALRAGATSTPILMLTARDSVADRVSGLSTGADDYLTKPFAFAELLARIRALLRRSRVAQPAVLRVADLTLDPALARTRRGPGRDARGRGVRRRLGAPRRGPRAHRRRRDPVTGLDGGGGAPGRTRTVDPCPRDRAQRGPALVRAPGQVRSDHRRGRTRRGAERHARHGPSTDAGRPPRPVARGRDGVRDRDRVRRGTDPYGVSPG